MAPPIFKSKNPTADALFFASQVGVLADQIDSIDDIICLGRHMLSVQNTLRARYREIQKAPKSKPVRNDIPNGPLIKRAKQLMAPTPINIHKLRR